MNTFELMDAVRKYGSELTNEEIWYMLKPPQPNKCACCGTTENLHRDYGSGGPYRCSSDDCMVF